MLQESIMIRVREDLGDEEWYRQQDGTPPQYHRDVRSFLNEILANRLIGRRYSVDHLHRSPEHTSSQFFSVVIIKR